MVKGGDTSVKISTSYANFMIIENVVCFRGGG